jgi:hypothetical protein
MTAVESVKLIDPKAQVFQWSDCGFWAKGTGWETKITYSIERAWELAVEMVASLAPQEAQ